MKRDREMNRRFDKLWKDLHNQDFKCKRSVQYKRAWKVQLGVKWVGV